VELKCDLLREDVKGYTMLDVAAVIGNTGILGLYKRTKEVEVDAASMMCYEPQYGDDDDSDL